MEEGREEGREGEREGGNSYKIPTLSMRRKGKRREKCHIETRLSILTVVNFYER